MLTILCVLTLLILKFLVWLLWQANLIDPCIKGTLNVLNSCLKANVKRFVLTSSCSSIRYRDDVQQLCPLNESHWTDTDYCQRYNVITLFTHFYNHYHLEIQYFISVMAEYHFYFIIFHCFWFHISVIRWESFTILQLKKIIYVTLLLSTFRVNIQYNIIDCFILYVVCSVFNYIREYLQCSLWCRSHHVQNFFVCGPTFVFWHN